MTEYEWRAVTWGSAGTLIRGFAKPEQFNDALGEMSSDDWEFAFFCDGPQVLMPMRIFRREVEEESDG